MKLLIVTQKVDRNDSILGFFHRWIEEFSKHCESLIVICLEKGEYDLPKNVKVLSLGKELVIHDSRFLILTKLKYVWNFYKYIFKFRHDYDSVFVHMNQVYVILGSIVWKSFGKSVGLWYTHKKVSLSLRIALALTDNVFTASEKSFRLRSSKAHVMGHGIDLDRFSPDNSGKDWNLLTVGRIAPVKNINVIIDALAILKSEGVNLRLGIVGGPVYPEDQKYFNDLKEQVKDLKLDESIHFLGVFTNEEIPKLYRKAEIFVNLSGTGSMDKAVLEAAACGIKILTSNESFREFLDSRYITTGNTYDLVNKIKELRSRPRDSQLLEWVREHHNLSILIPRILSFYTS